MFDMSKRIFCLFWSCLLLQIIVCTAALSQSQSPAIAGNTNLCKDVASFYFFNTSAWCAGSSVNWTCSASSSDVEISTSGGNVASFKFRKTGTFTIFASCSGASASLAVTVSGAPAISVTSSATIVEEGAQVTLSASGASTYSWTGAGLASNTGSQVAAIVPVGETTYTAFTTSGACTSSASVRVAATPSQRTYCKETGSVNLSELGADLTTGYWSGPAISGSAIEIGQLAAGQYTYTYRRNSDGFSYSIFVFIQETVAGAVTVQPISECGDLTGLLRLEGADGDVQYWEKSYDAGGSWISISSVANSYAYHETQSTQFRVAVRKNNCITKFAGASISQVDPVPGIISATSLTVTCNNISGSLKVDGSNASIVLWQKSYDNGNNWNTVSTGAELTEIWEDKPVSFRAAAKKDECPAIFTPTFSVEPLAPIGGFVSPSTIVHSCTHSSGQLELQSAKGDVQWEKLENGNTNWIPIDGEKLPFLLFETSTNTQFRARLFNGECASVNSTSYAVQVSANGGDAFASVPVACGTAAGQLMLSNEIGTIRYWEHSTNGVDWHKILSSDGMAILPYTTTEPTNFYRAVVGLHADCANTFSSVAIVSVSPPTIPGKVRLVNESSEVVNNRLRFTTTFRLQDYQGSIEKWLRETISVIEENNHTSEITFYLEETTKVLAQVKTSNCEPLLSGSALFVINQPFKGTKVSTEPLVLQEYDGYSYQVANADGISLRDGFSFIANSAQEFFVLLDENYSLPPTNESYVIAEIMLKDGIKKEDDILFSPATHRASEHTYLDGLGRKIQSVQRRGSINQTDIVKHFEYDAYGRETSDFLPFTNSSRDGNYQVGASSLQLSFYKSPGAAVARTDDPYALSLFQKSPLDITVEQGFAGTEWQPLTGHTKKMVTESNDEETVVRWSIDNTTGLPEFSGMFQKNELIVSSIFDEHNTETREYKDKRGLTVLKQERSGEGVRSTYYIFDDFNLLRYVIQPEGTDRLSGNPSQAFLDKWATQYRYDARKREIEKKIPGAEAIYSVYDDRDRLVLLQDGNQRAKEPREWLFTKYDELNRPIMTGIFKDVESLDQTEMQQKLDEFYATSGKLFEIRGSDKFGYTDQSFPTTIHRDDYLTVMYFDDYEFEFPLELSYQPARLNGLPAASSIWVTGELTGSMAKLLDGSNRWLYKKIYYDQYNNAIQTVSTDHLGGITYASDVYNFSRQLLKHNVSHTQGSEAVAVQEDYNYDHAGRVLTHYFRVNNKQPILLKEVNYNALGEVVEMNLHKKEDGTFLQSVDYRYNIRGWLTHINNSELINDGGNTNDDATDLFGMEIAYTKSFGSANMARYNGNISAIRWNSDLAGNQRLFNLHYDGANRLAHAAYRANTGSGWNVDVNKYNETINYDLNGNITRLVRNNGRSRPLDDLQYFYNGNVLENIDDAGDANNGFIDEVRYNKDFSFDKNGNLKVDYNKGIRHASQNYLNLIEKLTSSTGENLKYMYDAEGNKVGQRVFGSDGIEKPGERVDYIGNFMLADGKLEFINHSDGLVAMSNAAEPEYQYYLKDHLGNIHVTLTTKEDRDEPIATLEPANEDKERSEFVGYDKMRRVRSRIFDHTNGVEEGYSIRLLGGPDPDLQLGLIRSLEVLPGDKIEVEVYAKYPDADPGNLTEALRTLLTQIASGPASGGIVVDGSGYGTGWDADLSFMGLLNKPDEDGAPPKAYLNYLVFDEKFNFIPGKSGFKRLTIAARETGGDSEPEKLTATINIRQRGFVYIYLSNENETPHEVYFDDFKVTHTKSAIIQQDDFYPFGSSISENSFQRDNPFYKGSSYSNRFGHVDLGFRRYDPFSARFYNIDPLSELDSDNSPYQYAGNNPVQYTDAFGLQKDDANKKRRRMQRVRRAVRGFFKKAIIRLSGKRVSGSVKANNIRADVKAKPGGKNSGDPVKRQNRDYGPTGEEFKFDILNAIARMQRERQEHHEVPPGSVNEKTNGEIPDVSNTAELDHNTATENNGMPLTQLARSRSYHLTGKIKQVDLFNRIISEGGYYQALALKKLYGRHDPARVSQDQKNLTQWKNKPNEVLHLVETIKESSNNNVASVDVTDDFKAIEGADWEKGLRPSTARLTINEREIEVEIRPNRNLVGTSRLEVNPDGQIKKFDSEIQYETYAFGNSGKYAAYEFFDPVSTFYPNFAIVVPKEDAYDFETYMGIDHSVDAMLEKDRLSPNEIREVRNLIKDVGNVEEQKTLYKTLQEKVKYVNQRKHDIKAEAGSLEREFRRDVTIGDWMCQLTSIGQVLELFGEDSGDEPWAIKLEKYIRENYPVPNPLPADADYESYEEHPNYRTQRKLWIKLLKDFGYGLQILDFDLSTTNSTQKIVDTFTPILERGEGIILSISRSNGKKGHIVRVQAITDEGLVIDDPYGKSSIVSYYNGGMRFSETNSNFSSAENKNAGEDITWTWDDIENIRFKSVLRIYKED
jgi:RHS repeat-associated protein